MVEAVGRAGVKGSISPLAKGGLDEALGFAIGLGSIGLGEEMADLAKTQSGSEEVRAISRTVVGHEALNLDAQRGEVSQSVAQEGDGAGSAFIGKDLSEGNAGGIVDGDMDVFPAGTAGLVGRVTGKAMAGALDATEFFDIEVEKFAGMLALVANDRRSRVESREAGETVSGQDARDGGLGQSGEACDLEAREAQTTQRENDGDLGGRRAFGAREWNTTAIGQALRALGSKTCQPLSRGASADRESGRSLLDGETFLEDRLHHQGSTPRRQSCVTMDVHVRLVGWVLGSSQTHLLNSSSHEQSPETSHLTPQCGFRNGISH
jgi:hypothetical protein